MPHTALASTITPRPHLIFLVVLATMCVLALLPAAATALDTVFVVRHVEKDRSWDGASMFQPLAPEGCQRATQLAEILADKGVAAVYASPYTRTIASGLPLAQQDGIRVIADARTLDADGLQPFAQELRTRHADGRAVLIIGHSNTVGRVLAAFGADSACLRRMGIDAQGMIPDDAFDDLWRIQLGTAGCEGMMHLRQSDLATAATAAGGTARTTAARPAKPGGPGRPVSSGE